MSTISILDNDEAAIDSVCIFRKLRVREKATEKVTPKVNVTKRDWT